MGLLMSEEIKIEEIVSELKTRRSAIKSAAQVAVTAPAVGLLLSAGTKSAMATPTYVAHGDDRVVNPGDDGTDDVTINPGDDTHQHGF